jgi:hypothetical protein
MPSFCCCRRLGHRFGGDHAGLHRGVRALDLRHVQEARGAADHGAAGKAQFRDRLETAFVQRARAIADALRAFEGEITAMISTSSLSEWSDPFAGFDGALVRFGAPDLHAEHWTVEGSHPTGLATTGPTAE